MLEKINVGDQLITVVSEEDSDKYLTESDKEMDRLAKAAVEAAISKAKIRKKPVVLYDDTLKKPYTLYPNGEKKYDL